MSPVNLDFQRYAARLTFWIVLWLACVSFAFGDSVASATLPQVAPTVIRIIPSTAANNAGTPVTIQGAGFTTQTTASLESSLLATTYTSPTQLAATVPWGRAPGIYTLTVATPGQPLAVLTKAFTVTLGIGKWVNNGPFGGQVNDLVIQPGNPTRIYAAVMDAGLFMSTDGGSTWAMLINEMFPMRIELSPADPQVIYLNTNRSIRRSLDGGTSWSSIDPPDEAKGGTLAAFPHPGQPGTVFVAASPNMNNYNEGGTGELWISTDYGDTLAPLANAGLADKRITDLVFDPRDATHKTMLAGTIGGKIYLTTNGGAAWTQKADLVQPGDQQPARIDRLHYNAAGDGNPWAVKRNPFLNTDWPVLYRSNANLSTWTGIMVVDDPVGGPHPWFWMRPWSLMFASDRIWTAYDTGYTSANTATLKWNRLDPAGLPNENWRDFEFTVFAANPVDPDVIYGGTRANGVYKSVDGGLTWAAANHGLAGIVPYALAVAPDNLDEVYAVSQADGLAKSIDGGRHWTLAGFQRSGFPWRQTSLVVDLHNPDVVYLGQWCPHSRQPSPDPASDACVRISRDRGQTWEDVILPQPPPANFEHGEVFAVAVDPQQPGRVVAGATFYPFNWSGNVEHPYGAFYYSNDFGLTWTRAALDAAQVKGSSVIAYDDQVAGLVYAGTDGTGLWKSTDSGVTWERLAWTGCTTDGAADRTVSIRAVAARPGQANEVVVSCVVIVGELPQPSFLFRSTDAGLTWQSVSMPESGAEALLYLPSPAGLTLYAAGWSGAASSLDQAATWSPIEGVPTGTAYALAGQADEDRAVLYVSTAAGMGATGLREQTGAAAHVMAGGAYGFTQRLLKPGAYLPALSKK